MKNPLRSKMIEIDGKLMTEFPQPVAEKLAISPGDFIEFGNAKNITIWKSENIDIPEEVFKQLTLIFKSDEYVFHWLNSKQKSLLGRTPVQLLSEPSGKAQVLSLINRINRGDFS